MVVFVSQIFKNTNEIIAYHKIDIEDVGVIADLNLSTIS